MQGKQLRQLEAELCRAADQLRANSKLTASEYSMKVIFYGQEKAELNTRFARMNLAVHGLEGNIQEDNTFYEDKHNLVGGVDFVMANPSFNVDGVDKAKDAKDWSLSPGRYFGVDSATDDDFDYEERLNEIHIELEGLNEEAMKLASLISYNYKSLL